MVPGLTKIKIMECVASLRGITLSEVTDDLKIDENEMELDEIMCFVEEELEMVFTEDDFDEIKTVADLVKMAEDHLEDGELGERSDAEEAEEEEREREKDKNERRRPI